MAEFAPDPHPAASGQSHAGSIFRFAAPAWQSIKTTMTARVLFVSAVLLCQSAFAQSADPGDSNGGASTSTNTNNKNAEENGPQRFWQVTSPGGHYMVAIDRISAIGKSEYMLSGGIKATEVTVDTLGQAIARFYYLEPITAGSNAGGVIADRAKDVLNRIDQRTGTNVSTMVQKDYPTTTHARTIEYRLNSLADLEQLYKSLQNALESGRGKKLTIK